MLVEFSPWETTDTSLRLSVSKRKRPRGGLSSSSSVCEDSFPITGSIVTTKAGRRKQRNSPDCSRAVLAITSPHRVSVLVSKNKGSAAGAPKTEALDAADSLHESAQLQYSCRPVKNASFLPLDATPAKKIPVVFDSRYDRFWALQNDNKTLVVWDAKSEGPDSKGAKGVQVLDEPALSLDVLPNGGAIGSSVSGSIYYATADKDNSTIQLAYLPTNDKIHNEKSKELKHAGTFLSVQECSNIPSPTGGTTASSRKRKYSKGSDYGTIELYQVFVCGCTATILLHDLILAGDNSATSSNSTVSLERKTQKEAILSIVPRGMDGIAGDTIVQDATLVPSTISDPEHSLLYYKLRSSTLSERSNHYCCSFHLRSGTLKNPPYPIQSCEPQRLALVAPRILAVGLVDKIILCDSINGTVFHQKPLPFIQGDTEDFMLQADARKRLLVVLFRNGEHLNAATSMLRLEEAGDQSSFQSSLASRLAASLSVSFSSQPLSLQENRISPSPRRFTLLIQPEVVDVKLVDMQFWESIKMFQESSSLLLGQKGGSYKKGSLVEVFQRSVVILNESPIVLRSCSTCDMDKSEVKHDESAQDSNGQTNKGRDPFDDASERVNGIHHVPKSSLVNGAIESKTNDAVFNSASEATATDSIGSLKEKIRRIQTFVAKGKESAESKNDTDTVEGSERNDNGLPLSFVDAVTPTVVRILIHANESATRSKERAAIVKADCCEVLNSLLESGNVSVRKHFDDGGGIEPCRDFSGLLLCMGCKPFKDSKLRSPIDFIHNVLEYCADVSESQLVSMLHFMLCRASPHDIAMAFVESKYLPPDHPHRVLGARYVTYVAQDSCSDHTQNVESMKSRLIVAGCSAFLEKALSYSRCNQALLSVALRQTFSFGPQTGLLCRLLSDLAFSGSRKTLELQGSKKLVNSAAQWIPALLDAFSEELGHNDDASGLKDLVVLRNSLIMARRQTELLVGLEDSINHSEMLIPDDDGEEEEATPRTKKRKVKVDEDNLPAYSVERLVL